MFALAILLGVSDEFPGSDDTRSAIKFPRKYKSRVTVSERSNFL